MRPMTSPEHGRKPVLQVRAMLLLLAVPLKLVLLLLPLHLLTVAIALTEQETGNVSDALGFGGAFSSGNGAQKVLSPRKRGVAAKPAAFDRAAIVHQDPCMTAVNSSSKYPPGSPFSNPGRGTRHREPGRVRDA